MSIDQQEPGRGGRPAATDLSSLLEQAFFQEQVQNGSEAVERALEQFEAKRGIGGRVFEVVAPDAPDEPWVRDALAQPLVYYCESEGFSVESCAGVMVALYAGSTLYGLAADTVIRWASELLGSSPEQLHERYGTREVESVLR